MSKSKETPIIGLIASKNPVSALEVTVQSLFRGGAYQVVVVDDGSDEVASKAVFKHVEKLGATVIHLEKNVGKARALQKGFRTLPKRCIIIQTDDDTIAGDFTVPANMIREGKADIVDIRCEAVKTDTLIGLIQELNYWLVNAGTKRIQGYLGARLWLSGASAMYSREAGKVIILETSHCLTEDTEGLYRARSRGFKTKYYSGHEAQFLTMVPEDVHSLHRQWRRWTIGNAQVMGIYGLGGGNIRIAAVNAYCLVQMFLPIPASIHYGVMYAFMAFYINILIGFLGALRLKRARIAIVGMFLPFVAVIWTCHVLQGMFLAYRLSKSDKEQLTWVSPKRTTTLEAYTVQAV